MTRDDFIKRIQEKLDQPMPKYVIGTILSLAEETVAEDIRTHGEARWPNMIKFKVKTLPARIFHNPQNGDPIAVGSRLTLRATPLGKFSTLVKE